MKLKITKEQKKYLNEKGIISPASLQKAYRLSVEKQHATRQQAEQVLKAKKQ